MAVDFCVGEKRLLSLEGVHLSGGREWGRGVGEAEVVATEGVEWPLPFMEEDLVRRLRAVVMEDQSERRGAAVEEREEWAEGDRGRVYGEGHLARGERRGGGKTAADESAVGTVGMR